MSQNNNPNPNPLLHRGTRRLHKNSGEVWRLREVFDGPEQGYVAIVRESDGAERNVWLSHWLHDGWTSPTSRAGAQR